jgi:hypothetical protein
VITYYNDANYVNVDTQTMQDDKNGEDENQTKEDKNSEKEDENQTKKTKIRLQRRQSD